MATNFTDFLPAEMGTININGLGTAHWVEPPIHMWDALFNKRPKNYDEILEWTVQTFDKDVWSIDDTKARPRFLFKKKEDRTLFMMRWV